MIHKIIKRNLFTSINKIHGLPFSEDDNVYLYDFNACKKTIIISDDFGNYTEFIDVPKYSIFIITNKSHMLLRFIMGERNENILTGMKINGYKLAICSNKFASYEFKPENINELMSFYWQSTFPYYNRNKVEEHNIRWNTHLKATVFTQKYESINLQKVLES